MDDEPLIFGYTFESNARMHRDYPELRERNEQIQRQHLEQKIADEGYEMVGEITEPELTWFQIIDHGDDEDGIPIIEHIEVEEEQATWVRSRIEVPMRKKP